MRISWTECVYLDFEDLRERTVTVLPAEMRACRIDGPRVPLAPINATFLIAMLM